MMRSIRQRLTLLVLIGVSLVWIYSVFASYHQAVHEVDEWDQMRVEQLARTILLLEPGALPEFVRENLNPIDEDGDDDSSIHLEFTISDAAGHTLFASPGMPDVRPGSRDAGGTSHRPAVAQWQIYRLDSPSLGRSVTVFERRARHSEVASQIARRIARPMFYALPVLAIVLWLAISGSLTPLRTLSKAIGTRSADSLEPIRMQQIPDEVHALVHALNRLLERLRDSLDRERAFTADAAHELKSPLAAIKIQAQLALSARDPERQRRAMLRVVEAVDRSTHLADQLLALARLDENSPLAGVPVSLNTIAAECIRDQAPRAASKNIALTLHADETVRAVVPPVLLRLLLDNLVDNAIKYGGAGGRVEIAVWHAGHSACLAVRDNGPGVPQEDLQRLSSRFFRGEGHPEPGSGLGLSIVARIAARMSWDLSYTPGLDGSGFGVQIALEPCSR